ncbi:xylulokinase [Spirochaetia bacterium]|nr:xylulokinase [Spirochaetia bacterium]
MAVLLGIDLGTSSIKGILLDSERGETDAAARVQEVRLPKTGWAEQDPDSWWQLTCELLEELKTRHREAFRQIGAVGFSGQMHGLVPVDKQLKPLRPAMLWLDQRAVSETDIINELIKKNNWAPLIQNRVSAGFALPSLVWLKQFEPEVFKEIHYVLQPKDFIRMKMTGIAGVDYSDASATGAFSVKDRDWAWPLLRALEIPERLFPAPGESTAVAGYVTPECAGETGLPRGIPVVYGSGDQMAQSIGNGAVTEGLVIANIGTGGQIAAYSRENTFDEKLRTHTFCHAVNKAYTVFGATLCSGMSMHWLKNKILRTESYRDMDQAAAGVAPGSRGLIYLPYLSGERTPHMNARAKGTFFGLQLDQDYRFLIRAVMEGVTYSLKDCLTILENMGIKADRIIASGGGSKSPLWLQIQADIFEKEIQVNRTEEQACLGACILAGIGAGVFKNPEEACTRFVRFNPEVYKPDTDNLPVYRKGYALYQELYHNTHQLMEKI